MKENADELIPTTKQQKQIPSANTDELESQSSCGSNVSYHLDSGPVEEDEIECESLAVRGRRRFESGYKLGDQIGSGHFGTVFRVTKIDTGEEVAAKFLSKEKLKKGRPAEYLYEIGALLDLKHPNILRYKTFMETEDNYIIITELCHGSLEDKFEKAANGRLPEGEALEYMRQILDGLAYMHSQQVAHRDIKVSNILFEGSTLRIIDFGSSYDWFEDHEVETDEIFGTPEYYAPEVLGDDEPIFPTKCDIWACGVLFFGMLTGFLPFSRTMCKPSANVISREKIEEELSCEELEHLRAETVDILRLLLTYSHKERPTAAEALSQVQASISLMQDKS